MKKHIKTLSGSTLKKSAEKADAENAKLLVNLLARLLVQ